MIIIFLNQIPLYLSNVVVEISKSHMGKRVRRKEWTNQSINKSIWKHIFFSLF